MNHSLSDWRTTLPRSTPGASAAILETLKAMGYEQDSTSGRMARLVQIKTVLHNVAVKKVEDEKLAAELAADEQVRLDAEREAKAMEHHLQRHHPAAEGGASRCRGQAVQGPLLGQAARLRRHRVRGGSMRTNLLVPEETHE